MVVGGKKSLPTADHFHHIRTVRIWKGDVGLHLDVNIRGYDIELSSIPNQQLIRIQLFGLPLKEVSKAAKFNLCLDVHNPRITILAWQMINSPRRAQ